MHCHKWLALVTLLTLLPAYSGFCEEVPGPVKCLPLTAEDIADVTGLNIYKFRVAVEPGAAFELVIAEQDAADEVPRLLARSSFTSYSDANSIDLRLSFLPRDNALRGVLLSQDEDIEYRVDCEHCSPSGLATNIPLPLRDLPGTQKTLFPKPGKITQELSTEDEICLITILASENGRPASLETSYPRAIVSVKFVK